ncbi:MAG: response regulator, partial [Deltaproteobacteria bacterium]|nr:response regulator [Deltaproteobacteria bacterium]
MDEAPRILGVDSSLTIRKALDVVLHLAGYEVNTTADGSEALALAKSFKPALILLDASLHTMPTAEVCRRLATDAATARVPIVLIGAPDGEAQQACRDAPNVVGYLTKPFKSQTVTSLAAKVLSQAAVGDFFKTPLAAERALSKAPAPVTTAPRPAPVAEPTRSATETNLREALAQMDALTHNALTLRAQLEAENRTAKERARQAQAEAERSRARAEQLHRDNVELTAQLDAAHSRLADLETESGIYTAELERVEQERAQEHVSDAQRLETDAQHLATLDAALANLRTQLDFVTDSTAAREADLAQELVELRTHTATVEQTLSRVSAERADLHSTLDAARQQLAREVQVGDEQINRLASLEAERQGLIDRLAATRTSHAQAASAWQATTAQHAAEQELVRAEWTQRLQAQQSQLSAHIAELEAERATTQQQRVELDRELTTARVELSQREAALHGLQQQLGSVEKETATSEAIHRELIDRTATLEAELHRGEIALAAARLDSAQQLEAAHAQAKAAQTRVAAANGRLQALTAERATAQQQCAAAERELATAREELEQQRAATEVAARESTARLATLDAERQA